MVEGEDYVICPLCSIRMSMIKSTHITNRHKMPLADFDLSYPNTQKICKNRVINIKNGLAKTDENGLTKHQISVAKAQVTKNAIGEDGLSIHQKIGIKTRNTHLRNKDENGLNGYQRIAKVARPKQIKTMARNGDAIKPEERHQWLCYRNLCIWLTRATRAPLLTDDMILGRAGSTSGNVQVDHEYSVFHGYRDGVSPFDICNIVNLVVLPWEENVKKNRKSSISLDELLQRNNTTMEDSKKEYDLIIKLSAGIPQDNRSSILLYEQFLEESDAEICKKRRL